MRRISNLKQRSSCSTVYKSQPVSLQWLRRRSLLLQVRGNASEKIRQGSSLTVGVQSACLASSDERFQRGQNSSSLLTPLRSLEFLPTLQFPASLHSYNESIILQPLLNGMRNCGFVGLAHKIPSGT